MTTSHVPPGATWPHVMPRPEVRIAAVYLVLASIWVIFADYAVHCALPERPISAKTMNGLNLIATTSVLLYFVLRRAYRGWRQAEREQWKLLSEVSDGFRALSARAESQREEDRTRISRELHDQLGQALTGMKLDLRWIESQLERHDDRSLNPITDRLVEVGEQVDDLITTVQSIAADLRPDALDNLGLNEAMQQEGELFARRTGVPCTLEGGGCPKNLPAPVTTAAFRIFQEALTNVIRHADATRVQVQCEIEGDWLKLSIADDGKGIFPERATNGTSLGLLGMRERAELLGGHLKIAPGDTSGTIITAYLPWKTNP